VLPRMRCV